MEGQTQRAAGVSGNLDELQGRMLAKPRRFRFRSTAVSSLIVVAVVSGMGFAAVLLWHQVGASRLVAGHAASSVQAN